jgi:hypothetical protein
VVRHPLYSLYPTKICPIANGYFIIDIFCHKNTTSIPTTSMTNDVGLSPKEAMDKMSRHFLDVSFSSLLAIHMTSLIGLGELIKFLCSRKVY